MVSYKGLLCLLEKNLALSLVVLLMFVHTACIRSSKKPEEKKQGRGLEHAFAQGQDNNLYNIKIISNASKVPVIVETEEGDKVTIPAIPSVVVKTASQGESVKISETKSGVIIEPSSKVAFINNYFVLDYEIKSSPNEKLFKHWIGDLKDFKGFPNTEYEIVPELKDNFLIFYRVSDPDKIPYIEKPLAEKTASGKLKTPLVGIPIKYCVAERKLNLEQEKTHQYIKNCSEVLKSNAQYIHIDANQKIDFQYLSKEDIFLREFFAGQWFYSGETIVKAPGDAGVSDMKSAAHHSLKSVQLIEFESQVGEGDAGGRLQLIDASGYKIREADKIKGQSIPVNWLKYQINADIKIEQSKDSFREVIDKDSPVLQRPYAQIQFDKLARQFHPEASTAETVSVYITDDYFSFTIRTDSSDDEKKSQWFKYSFRKNPNKKSNYVEKRWIKEDADKYFPTFFIDRRYYKTLSDPTIETRNKFKRVLRFNPLAEDGSKTREIKWYFSTETPTDQWIRDFGRRAVVLWNKVFEIAGQGSDYKIKIILDETTDREIGDIRYNIINLLYSLDQSGTLLGYGPQMASPLTGESLSAIATVWINNALNSYQGKVRKYILFNIYTPEWRFFPEFKVSWFKKGEVIEEKTVENKGQSLFIQEKIKRKCPEVEKYISDNKSTMSSFKADESLRLSNMVNDCAKKVAEIDILNTLLHEMGHNFGLRHFFAASADEDNFYESYDEVESLFGTIFGSRDDLLKDDTDSYTQPARFSSVMDYGNFNYPTLTTPGKLDIDLIRYLYFDKLELVSDDSTSKKFVTIQNGVHYDENGKFDEEKEYQDPLQKPISQQLGDQKLKQYTLCKVAEENVRGELDPMCFPYDYGATPLEIAQNIVNDAKSQWDSAYFYDQGQSGNLLSLQMVFAQDILASMLRPTMRFFEHYTHLMSNWITAHPEDLHIDTVLASITPETSRAVMEQYANKAKLDLEFKRYYESVDFVIDTVQKLIFMPPKQCIYQTGSEYNAVSLESIILKLRSNTQNHREVVHNCKSPVIEKWAKDNQLGNLVTEVGYFFYNPGLRVKINSEEDSLFRVPMEKLFITSISLDAPAFPWITMRMIDELSDYFLKGRDMTPYLDEDARKKIETVLPRFPTYEIDSKSTIHFFQRQPVAAEALTELRGRNSVMYQKLQKLIKLSKQVVLRLDNSLLSEEDKKIIREKLHHTTITNSISLNQFIDKLRDDITMKDILSADSIVAMAQYFQNQGIPTASSQERFEYLINNEFVCYRKDPIFITLPFHLSEDSVYSSICQKFNKYKKCILESRTTPCEDFENKKAYVDFYNR